MGACSATTRQGKQCRQQSILGGSVCRYHGGAAPQVQRKARERLAALVDPAIGQLSKLIRSKQGSVSLGAVKDVLDRTGYKPKDVIEQTNYSAEDVERLEALTDEELAVYISLKRKLSEPGGSGSPTEAPAAEQASEVVSE